MSFYTPIKNIPQIVNTARAAFRSGRAMPAEFRKRQLRQLLSLVQENEKTIAEACMKDLHKPSFEVAVHEVAMVRSDIADHLNHLDEWMAPRPVSAPLFYKMDGAQIRADPLGVVLIIGAWNYPIQLTLVPMVGAIAAGNAVVLKPSEVSGATAELLAQLIPKYLDPELYPVINGGVAETSKVLEQKFDKILYTGNGMVGKVILEAAAKHLTPVILELGGKSPAIIDRDVDMRVAARRIAWGRFTNCGQTCVAPDYVLINREQQDSFITEMKAALKEFYGDDIQNCKDYGRIVNERHWQRISDLLTKSGGKVVIGGQTDKADKFIAPTVVVDCDEKSSILSEEIFGPVLPIVNVKSIDDAIEYVNSRDKPLALYVFSNNASVCDRVLNTTSSGGAIANDCLMQCAVSTLPFGGIGPSGMGAYHGKHSFDAFSHQKGVLFKKLALEAINSARYAPYSSGKLSFLEYGIEKPHGPIYSFLTGPFRYAVFALILALFYRLYAH